VSIGAAALSVIDVDKNREVLRQHGAVALLQSRLMRISEEAREQGAVLTQEDLGVLLCCDERTFRRDIKREAVARACLEIDAQGGCVAASELAIMFKTTPTTVGKYIVQWEVENGKVLPRRGTIHDMGPTLTHKKEICRLLFIEGKTVSQVVNLTKHSTRSIDRYITNFRQVFTYKIKGLTVQETALATKLNKRLAEEHHRLFDEYAVTNAKFDALLKGLSKN
jgi:hypothetical protein